VKLCPLQDGRLTAFIILFHSSSVGIATRYRLDGPGIGSRWERDFPHPCGRCVALTTYPQLTPTLKKRVQMHLYSPSGPSWPVIGRTLALSYYFYGRLHVGGIHMHSVCGKLNQFRSTLYVVRATRNSVFRINNEYVYYNCVSVCSTSAIKYTDDNRKKLGGVSLCSACLDELVMRG
jgi:hypothetical protein